jgi:hypothetical protein
MAQRAGRNLRDELAFLVTDMLAGADSCLTSVRIGGSRLAA